MSTIRLIEGDCRIVVRQLEAASIDLVCTDPPYGETSLAWDVWPKGWLNDLARVLKPHGSIWVFGSQRMFIEQASEFARWSYAQDLVWEKHNGSGLHVDRFRRVHEHAVQFYPRDRAWAGIYKKPVFTNDAVARTVRRKNKPAHWGGRWPGHVYVRGWRPAPDAVRDVRSLRAWAGPASDTKAALLHPAADRIFLPAGRHDSGCLWRVGDNGHRRPDVRSGLDRHRRQSRICRNRAPANSRRCAAIGCRMSAKPVTGAILVLCEFCGQAQRPLEWKPGTGWVCASCGVDMKGNEPKEDAE